MYLSYFDKFLDLEPYLEIDEKEWEYINKDINGNIGDISWSRVIEDKEFIRKFKSLVELKDTSS